MSFPNTIYDSVYGEERCSEPSAARRHGVVTRSKRTRNADRFWELKRIEVLCEPGEAGRGKGEGEWEGKGKVFLVGNGDGAWLVWCCSAG